MSSYRMTAAQFKRQAEKVYRMMTVESVEVEQQLIESDDGGGRLLHIPTVVMRVTLRGSYRVPLRRKTATKTPRPRR